ncbi:uncharacterized protein LOC142587146 [Dermacentor variabilis]|uniref:uncharacterized protein LOC142587146 n=1 Tax=Dermacentor variabilis TaxID=34621 RepID=UPI003F5B4827
MPGDGDCDSQIDKWYYNKKQEKCENFQYGDCPRNENIFDNETVCQNTCKNAITRPEENETDTGTESVKGGGGGESPAKTISSKGSDKLKTRKPKKPNRRPVGVSKYAITRPEENETGTGTESVKGGGGDESPAKTISSKGSDKLKTRKPKKPNERPVGVSKSKKGAGRANCGVRAKKGTCEDYTDMWFNDAEFYTCSRVPEGRCPTHGSFYESCEDCMTSCRKAKVKQCAVKS